MSGIEEKVVLHRKLIVLLMVFFFAVIPSLRHEVAAADSFHSDNVTPKDYADHRSEANTASNPKKGKGSVTGDHNARISVIIPEGISETKIKGIEVTVQPDIIDNFERFIIMVFAVRSEESSSQGEEYLGSYTFFAPVTGGSPVTFFTRAPKKLELTEMQGGGDFEIEIRLEPVTPDRRITETVLTVLDARVIE